MAKLATDIIEIVDVINLYKKKSIGVNDIFKLFSEDRSLLIDDVTESEIREILEISGLSDFGFGVIDISETDKNKRLLN